MNGPGQLGVRTTNRAATMRINRRQYDDYAMLATCRIVLDSVDAPRPMSAATARREETRRPRRAARLFHSARPIRFRPTSSAAA